MQSELKLLRDYLSTGVGDRSTVMEALPVAHLGLRTDEVIRVMEALNDDAAPAVIEGILHQRPLVERVEIITAFPDEHHLGYADQIARITTLWGQTEPAAARTWLNRLGSDLARGWGLTALLQTLEEHDPDAAMKMVASLTDREVEDMICYGRFPKFSQWTGRQLAQAAEGFESKRLRTRWLTTEAIDRMAEEDAADALRFIAALPLSDRAPRQGRALVIAWLNEAPASPGGYYGVLQRIQTDLPEGTRSLEHFYEVGEAWANYQPDATRAWIKSLPAGEQRDHAILGFLRQRQYQHFRECEELVAMIHDEELRSSRLQVLQKLREQRAPEPEP